ncbi:MAG TPA: IS3 family transposase [Acholeplasmataceae bacterium]|nr:IS3 family transposase [Acholeplasmataceae bacterium]
MNQFESVADFIVKLTEYINYYNNERLPLKLKGLTPIQYRNQSLISGFI